MEDNEFIPHSVKQDEAIFSQAPITLLGTGIQYGKTISGAHWLKLQLCQPDVKPSDAFIVTSPTYKILGQSTLPPVLKVLEGMGEYNQQKAEFKSVLGPVIYFRTGKDPDSIVGITNVKAIWGDEAGKYTLYFWENIQGRAAFKKAKVLLTTSPYTMNWIWKDLIKPYRMGKRPDLRLIQAASWENPYFGGGDPEYIMRKRSTMDDRRFQMMFGGEWGQMHGLVYDCWDDGINLINEIPMPMGTKYYGGIDWGFTDPFVFKIRAVTPDGKHYGISEFYKTGMTVSDMCHIVKQKHSIFHLTTVFCDPSRPEHIEELNRHGIPAIGSDNDIRRGIDAHYELIKTGRYKEFKGACPYTQDEIQSYHYPEPGDLEPDQNRKKENPVDQSNHCLDTDRYITMGTLFLHKERKIKELKTDNPFAHIFKKKDRSAEEWSAT